MASFALGLLVAIIGISLLITIAFTILLIRVLLLGLLVMEIAIVYGWIACVTAGVRYVKDRWELNLNLERGVFIGTLFFIGLINLLSRLSTVGVLLLLLISCLGLGAVFLTRFGLRSFVPVTDWEENQL